MPIAELGDVNIYYEVHGSGEPLVLITGYGGSSSGWFRQIPVLSRRYQVVAFDNRGTGRSDKPDIPYSMEMMAGDIAGILEVTNIDAAHILGVSMGGMIAQEFALCYPEKVISLILGCTHCGASHAILPETETTALFDTTRRDQMTPEDWARERLPASFSQDFIDNNPDIIERVIAISVEYPTPPQGYRRQAEAIEGHDTYDLLAQIKSPTLVIGGDADQLIPIENSRLIVSRIPDAELFILKKAGHRFWIEQTDETNQAILDFLRRHPYSG